ncbi:MAG: tetraether lipid synthase Tes, partial [Candidatus Sifarchaeia archaeon]
ILIGAMHFMDPYNYYLQRVNHCCIYYGIPDGRIIPFCAYNTLHREKVEKELSIPLSEWRERNAQTAKAEI